MPVAPIVSAKKAYKALMFNALALGGFTLLVWLIKQNFVAFFWGGLTFLLPHAIFTWFAFRHQGALMAHHILKDFCLGELIKFMGTLTLFYVGFRFIHAPASTLFIGYLSMLLLQWGNHLVGS